MRMHSVAGPPNNMLSLEDRRGGVHALSIRSLLCLNGIALASGNSVTLLASLAATCAAYSYRVKVEDAMLLAALGASYAEYRGQLRALLPSFRSSRFCR